MPIGRATKASAKIAKEYSVPVNAFVSGNTSSGKDQHGGDGVNEEVEEFRRPADNDADGDLAGIESAIARFRCPAPRSSVVDEANPASETS